MSATYQLNWARTLVRHVTGEEYGDGYRITNLGVGYAEPGYPSDAVWVLGNWNNTQPWSERQAGLEPTHEQRIYCILGDILDSIGVELEWLDEWVECCECYRIVRSAGNSYHWKPSYLWADGYICHECAKKDLESALTGWGDDSESFINNHRKVITFCEPSDVEALGFTKWEPGNPHTYEHGWHPGQTDTSEPILASILERFSMAEVVFFLDEASQFYIRFSAYMRIPFPGESE